MLVSHGIFILDLLILDTCEYWIILLLWIFFLIVFFAIAIVTIFSPVVNAQGDAGIMCVVPEYECNFVLFESAACFV